MVLCVVPAMSSRCQPCNMYFFRATESIWMSQWCIYALCQTNAIMQLQCQILAFSSKNGYEHWTEFVGMQRSLGKEKWECLQVLFKSKNPNSPIYSQLFIKSLKVKLHAWLRWLYGCFDFWTEKRSFCFRDVIKSGDDRCVWLGEGWFLLDCLTQMTVTAEHTWPGRVMWTRLASGIRALRHNICKQWNCRNTITGRDSEDWSHSLELVY